MVSKQSYLNERGIKKLFYVNYFVFYNTDLITIFFNKFLNSSIYQLKKYLTKTASFFNN